MSRPPSLADALGYFADLGWTEVRRAPAADAAAAPADAVDPGVATTELPASRVAPPDLATLERSAAEVAECRRCRLCETRTRTVFASGDPAARLMIVGEGPGADEDRQGLPFVGEAGRLLDRIIAAIGLERGQVYVANVVKCRPPGNRNPQPDEIAACLPYLEAQIDAVQPAVLVALGRVAAQTLLGNESSIARLRGQWHEVRGVPTMVTYHPAALLRDANYKRPTWEDMQQVRDRLSSS